MNFWVAAFVGDGAHDNFEITNDTGDFFVSSNRTPVRKLQPGDPVLLYLAGAGFVTRANAVSGVRTPDDEARWSGKKPLYVVPLNNLQTFGQPVAYKFSKDGINPVLGLHRYSLVGGFAGLSEEGFRDVLRRAGLDESPRDRSVERLDRAPSSPQAADEGTTVPEMLPKPSAKPGEKRRYKKRMSGQHASREGRKRATLWTVAEIGASTFGLKGVERFARGKVGEAERTWIAGGRGEQRVGAVLEELCESGFYVFHDVKLPDFGNVDHVVIGPHGFFAVETKSHKGRVSARGGELLRNGRELEKNFIRQTWNGCYRLNEILDAEVTPILCFSEAFVEGYVSIRGVRVLPLNWLKDEILRSKRRIEKREVATAVNVLGAATGCYPSAGPRVGRG